ncbi:MAG: hypothetical protein GTO63_05600 [Anaerolineae bacterium]|nr:hypothetical protein [Anaerolineae bacterium]NIN94450.1 hypothetical protein [Anaerolineae bacterium]NIQ77513.1 hypothetical protein [Anaerolineae bacterium]
MLRRVTKRAREGYEVHRDFVLLAILFTSFRLMALLLFEPGGYILDWSGYYIPGASFVELSDRGFYPFVHYWLEYPPPFPWLAVIVYRLSMLLPAWREPNLWFDFLLGSTFLVFETGNLILVYAIALKLRGREGALRCAWLYAGLFFPVMTLLFTFDSFPLFFLLLGVYMVVSNRPLVAGTAAGTGFMIKLLPALVVPVALRVFPRISQRIAYLLAATSVALLIGLPFFLANATFFLTTFLRLGSVAPWETIWAFLDGYYTGGEAVPLEMRFDPTNVVVSFHQSRFPYLLVAVAFVAVYLILYTRRIDWQDNLKAITFCGLSINLVLIFSKGYSSAWMVNLLPFIILLMPNLRGVTYSLLLTMANVLEFPIALVLIANHSWIFILAVLYRTLLLAVLSVEFGFILFPSMKGQRFLRLALTSLVLLTVLGSVPAGVLAVRDYAAERYDENAYVDTIDLLRRQGHGAVIFTDQRLYQQLYPFLVGGQGLYLLEDDERLESNLAELADRHDTVWVLYTDSEDDQRSNPAVERWLSDNEFPMGIEWLSNARITRYSTTALSLRPHRVRANFASQIEFVGCAFDEGPLRPTDVLHVTLSWRALDLMDKDYTVFVHLIDEGERVWAQHDAQPAGGWRPTSSWQRPEEIGDNHGLALPTGIPPGEYRLALGLYDAATGQRLSVITDQQPAPGDRVLLGPVVIKPPEG